MHHVLLTADLSGATERHKKDRKRPLKAGILDALPLLKSCVKILA